MSNTSWTTDAQTPVKYADLSGDRNPVHLDPKEAQAAGFPTNIVHGMCVLGAVASAAGNDAPGMVLRKLDIRFAGPSFPGETLELEGTPKELPNGTVRVGMKVSSPSQEKGLMSPANFVFGPAEIDDELRETLLKGAVVERDEKDIAAEDYTFTDEDVQTYLSLTQPETVPDDAGLPMLMGTLGLTDALWFAFSEKKPEEPGNFVHLRQSCAFVEPIHTGIAYRCLVQAGLLKINKTPVGAMMTIPLIVQESESEKLVQTGVVTLLYVLDKA